MTVGSYPHAPSATAAFTPAAAAGTKAAEEELGRLAQAARRAIETERDQAAERLTLWHQGLAPAEVEAQVAAERDHYAALLGALAGVKVALYSACGFAVNR